MLATTRIVKQTMSKRHIYGPVTVRPFSDWRKQQIDKLEKKFQESNTTVEKEEDLQPMWKGMESRVRGRRPKTVQENGGRTGRRNIKKTDEDVWLEQGLYDGKEDESK